MRIIKSNSRTTFSLYFGFAVLCFATFFGSHDAHAMVVRVGETYSHNENATLEDDLYVLGETVSLLGTTTGDVYAAGSFVEQAGVVSEDLFIVSGNVQVNGEVQGDLRVLGGKVDISGHVTEDLFVAGGTVVIEEGAVIDGDIFVIADHLTLMGRVEGLAELKVRIAEITGIIGESLSVTAKEAVSLKGNAEVYGDFMYSAPRDAFISEDAVVEGVTDFTQSGTPSGGGRYDIFGLLAFMVLTVVSAVVLVFFFPAQSAELTKRALNENTGMNLFKGLLLLFAWPLIAIILMITVVGVIPGLVLLLLYGLVFVISLMIAPVLSGVLLAQWFKKGDEGLKPAWASLGAIVFVCVAFLPLIGFVVRALLFLLSFYAVSDMFYNGVWKVRKTTVPTQG